MLLTATALVGGLAPPLVQHYLVDPNPLLSEQPYLDRSIAATRAGLGLESVEVRPPPREDRFRDRDSRRCGNGAKRPASETMRFAESTSVIF